MFLIFFPFSDYKKKLQKKFGNENSDFNLGSLFFYVKWLIQIHKWRET